MQRLNLLDLARSALADASETVANLEGALPLGAHYRWRVIGSRCGVYEVCFLPEATHAEVSALYPGAAVSPLPDPPTAE